MSSSQYQSNFFQQSREVDDKGGAKISTKDGNFIGLSTKNHQQQSYANQNTFIPGALGIGASTSASAPNVHTQNPAAVSGWTLSSDSANSGSGRTTNGFNPLRYNGESSGSRGGRTSMNPPAFRPETRKAFAGPSTESSRSQINGMGRKQADANSSEDFIRISSTSRSSGMLDGTAQVVGSNGLGNGSNTRNFLVPIGSTGARQKLSILSASQRPATSQSTMTDTKPPNDAIIQQYRDQIDAAARRRPATGIETDRGSSGRPILSDPILRNVQHSRSMSLAEDQHSVSKTASSTVWSVERPNNDDLTVDKLRSLTASTSSTQFKPHNSPFRSMSQQDLRESISRHSPTQNEFAIHGQAGRPLRLGKNWRQPSRDGSVKSIDEEGDDNATYQHQGEKSIVYARSSDNLRGIRSSRPASSSSNKDRAIKIGAGIKNIFGSKTIKEMSGERSANESANSLYDENHANDASSSFGSSTSIKEQQHQLKRFSPQQSSTSSFTRVEQSPRSLAIDVAEAKNAGWTSLPLKQDVTRLPRNVDSISSISSMSKRGLEVGGVEPTKSSSVAPLIDFQLPITNGLFDDFTTESLFSFSDISGDKAVEAKEKSNGKPLMVDQEATLAASRWKEQHNEGSTLSTAVRPPAKTNALLPERMLTSMPSASRLSESSSTSLRKAPNLPETPRGPSAPVGKTPLRNTPSYDRLASLSSLNASNRRESDATRTGSEAHDAVPFNAPAMSASSSAESTYSAPNSSRAWTPSNTERSSLPITSPLLASVLGQHVQAVQQHNVSAENVVSPPRKIRSPLAASDTATPSTPISLPSEWERIPDNSTSSPADSSNASPRAKPDLPTKSRERQTSVRSATAAAQIAQQPIANELFSSDESMKNAQVATEEKGVSANLANQSSFVPPGALTYTRKGTAVKPNITKPSPASSSLEEKGKANVVGAWNMEKRLPLPQFQSRSSIASSDPDSTPHGSSRPPDGATSKGRQETKTSTGRPLPLSSDDYDSYDHEEDSGSIDAVNLLPASAWSEVDSALIRFRSMSNANGSSSDKGGLLRTVLLPFLALEAETIDVQVSGPGPFQSGKSRRTLFFDWIQQLLLELQTVQTSADRGAILESIACIIESRNFSATMFEADPDDSRRFYSVFGSILSYAIGELNKKGVYQNTLIFSGRLLAVAFFRIEGVASKLLRALPVNRFAMERVAAEIKWDDTMPQDWQAYKNIFPPSLHDFCFQDARSYLKLLDLQSTSPAKDDGDDDDRYLVRQDDVEVEMSGNWLRRWQSDDSELFFSFCRSYHRHMATLLTTGKVALSLRQYFFGGPGYAHLATCIHQKCLSLVHRDILSVTTLSSQKNFNPGETANVLSGSTAGKPRHLEAANRRCTAIVVDIIRAPSANQHHTFGPMLGIHIKCLIKRTSLYDVQGVFCLLDWLDGVLNHLETAELPIENLVDVEFVIQTIWLLLKDADHALALMRTIAFCYSNFAILTSTSKNRIRFCQEILLHPKIFQKLFLSWSFTIRAYFLHLLVFRLARITDFAQPEDDIKGKTSISVAKLFNQRLDEIRRRHDELSPPNSSAHSASEEGEGDSSRFKHRPQSFVSTIKHTGAPMNKAGSPASMRKAEKLLGIGQPDPALSSKGGESKAQSRAAKWLRALGSKGTSKNGVNKRLESTLLPGVTMWGGSPTIENMNAFDNGHTRSRKRLASVADDSEVDLERKDEKNDGSDLPALLEDGVDDMTPTREGTAYEFNFEGRPGHEQDQTGQGTTIPPPDYEDEEKAANEHISRKLSFDLQSPHSVLPPSSLLPDGNPSDEDSIANEIKLPVPGSHSRVSRAFNRRQSLLPGPAYDLVHHDSTLEEDESGPLSLDSNTVDVPDQLQSSNDSSHIAISSKTDKKLIGGIQEADPYRETLHIYAVQSLREYEQTVLEHDEFFAKQVDEENPQVPRLPIQWPAMWSE